MKTYKLFFLNSVCTAIGALFFTSCANVDYDDALQSSNRNTPQDEILSSVLADGTVQLTGFGHVYVQGNEPGTNQIFIFHHEQEGNLKFDATVASGGSGTGAPLTSQGSLALSQDNQMLFAVNAGSNSISSFKVYPDGSLELTSTIGSGGILPVSLTVHQNHLYVVHAGNATIKGFNVSSTGILSPISNSERKLSDDTSTPVQIAFTPNGLKLYVTELKTNKIGIFPVDNLGMVGQLHAVPSVGESPFGFDFARNQYLVVANSKMGIAFGSSATCYSGINSGNINAVNAPLANGQTHIGHLDCTRLGRFAYVSNTASDNLSAYNIGPGGALTLVEADIACASRPTDLSVAANNFNVFVLCPKDQTIQEYIRLDSGSLQLVRKLGGIPDSASGMVCW